MTTDPQVVTAERQQRARDAVRLMETFKLGIAAAQPRSVEEVLMMIDGVIAEAKDVAARPIGVPL